MTEILESFVQQFHQDTFLIFPDTDDLIGAVLSEFDESEKKVLRLELGEFLRIDDALLIDSFERLGADWYFSEPSGLRAFLTYVIDRIDGRSTEIVRFKQGE